MGEDDIRVGAKIVTSVDEASLKAAAKAIQGYAEKIARTREDAAEKAEARARRDDESFRRKLQYRIQKTADDNARKEADSRAKALAKYGDVVDRATKKFTDANKYLEEAARSRMPIEEKQKKNLLSINEIYTKYRKAITGVLIDLHFLRIVGQSSQVVNRSFEALNKTLGMLVDVILIPMVPIFMLFVQGITQLAGIILRMPAPLRLAIGAIAAFTISLLATATLIKSILGFAGVGAVAKRASGGPLSHGQAAIVGERGPELLLPTGGGYHVVPNGQLRFLAEGTDTGLTETGGGLLTAFAPAITSGITNLTTGGAEAFSNIMRSTLEKESVQNIAATLGIVGGTIGAVLAPLSGIMGVGGVMTGGFMGVIKAVKGSGQSIVSSVIGVGTAVRSVLSLILLSVAPKAIVGAAAGVGIAAWILGLIEDLKRLWEAIKEVYETYIKPIIEKLKEIYESYVAPFVSWVKEKIEFVWGILDQVWDFLGTIKEKIIHFLGLDENPIVNFIDWLIDKILKFLGIRKEEGGGAPTPAQAKQSALTGLGFAIGRSASNVIPGTHQIAHGLSTMGLIPAKVEEMFTWEKSQHGAGFPFLQGGGSITSPGLAYLHSGETVIPAGGSGTTINITVQGSMDNRTMDELIRRMKLELTRVR